MTFEVHTFVSGPLSTNAHVVLCSSTGDAWIIDAPHGCTSTVTRFFDQVGACPRALILTHSHWDHIGDAALLQKQWNIPIWVHAADRDNCEHPGADGVPCWMPCPPCRPDREVQEGELLQLGHGQWQVLHTPGHTPGGICLWQQQKGLLITGDTLFKGCSGRTDLSTGNEEAMQRSLNRLRALPLHTLIFPGHGPGTVLRDERWLNDSESNN
jgi:hydroxyacylglutathione hydrolase